MDWSKAAPAIKREHEKDGFTGRYGAGLPRISDGSLLFLQHMIAKMKPASDGGSRLAIIFSGSPLFSGAAGSGESEIRRWILENDLLEGIVALPDQLFYNTGISTYFWVVTNRKSPQRAGKVVLLDARGQWAKMRKSLGDKRKYLTDEQIAEVTRLYHDALALDGHDERIKVFRNGDFGYRRITVERPLRCRWTVTQDVVERIAASKLFVKMQALPESPDDTTAPSPRMHDAIVAAMRDLIGTSEDTEAGFMKRVYNACTAHRQVGLPATVKKVLLDAAAVADPDAPVVTDRKGQPLPDPDLRDNENVPLSQDIDDYVAREVLPHVPDAWIDHSKTRAGYEIPFTRHFYKYTAPRPLAEIDAELDAVESEIQQALRRVAR